MKTLQALWNDESGAIVSTEIVLVITILGIGMVVGLAAVRNSVTTELADVAQAVANVNQSYSYSGQTGHSATTAGSQFNDTADWCDPGPDSTAKCVSVTTAAVREGTGG